MQNLELHPDRFENLAGEQTCHSHNNLVDCCTFISVEKEDKSVPPVLIKLPVKTENRHCFL